MTEHAPWNQKRKHHASLRIDQDAVSKGGRVQHSPLSCSHFLPGLLDLPPARGHNRFTMRETQKQFFLARVALSARERAKRSFPSESLV